MFLFMVLSRIKFYLIFNKNIIYNNKLQKAKFFKKLLFYLLTAIMNTFKFSFIFSCCFLILISACDEDQNSTPTVSVDQDAIQATFGNNIDLTNLANYASQSVPNYITKDNTTNNPITDAGATLGRVLFYDNNLSIDNSIACASCHKQHLAFGDDALASEGVNGTTGRHSMRLVNSRFARERRFFWDERATSLENQTTQPIQDHIEMGFSGQDGNPDFGALISKLENIEYYQELFAFVYGDTNITEARIQNALAQFIRSIQSFDSKYDAGRIQTETDIVPFPNFSTAENNGKHLFIVPAQFNSDGVRIAGGVGCNGCHTAPEFDIDPRSGNNGFVRTIDQNGLDFSVTKAPSLRDLVRNSVTSNGPFMHAGNSDALISVINHYNQIPQFNPNLDPRLAPQGSLQNLALTNQEKADLVAFLRTLSGQNIYTDEKWSDPF